MEITLHPTPKVKTPKENSDFLKEVEFRPYTKNCARFGLTPKKNLGGDTLPSEGNANVRRIVFVCFLQARRLVTTRLMVA